MKKLTILTVLLLGISITQAAVFEIGPDKTYANPNSLYLANVLSIGDTIEIDAHSYSGIEALAVWQADNLLIRGIGGKPKMIADGHSIWGKGIWVLAGNDITVEHIEFSGATVPDHNGAGIRLDGTGMTIRYCYFHNNENGILTSNPEAGNILIEYSEFNNNGYGDGLSHNLYIGKVNKLIFRYNYSHHAKIGHNLKSRANENFILYNRIMDEETGNSSRLIDISNGGFTIVLGNLLMQGPNAENNTLIGYGLEGLTNSAAEFYAINNSMVNKRVASCRFFHLHPEANIAYAANNILAGSGTLVDGNLTVNLNNLIINNIDSVYFSNEQEYDYRLSILSPAINGGIGLADVSGHSITPNEVYLHPQNHEPRILENEIDIGAYEFNTNISIQNLTTDFKIFPNPTRDKIFIKNKLLLFESFKIFNTKGQLVLSGLMHGRGEIDTSTLNDGLYHLEIKTTNTRVYSRFIKQ